MPILKGPLHGGCINVINDIFDNFHKYTTEEKQMIANLLTQMKEVNEKLEGYDNCSKKWYEKWWEAFDETF